MVQSGKNWRGDDRSAPLDSSLTAHPSPTPSACATHCNKTNMKPAFAADAARRQSEHDPATHVEAFRSGVQRMGSATATSVIWVGHESPSPEFGAERSARRHDHRHANSNFAVIHFFWDRILGTYRRPDAGQTQANGTLRIGGPAKISAIRGGPV